MAKRVYLLGDRSYRELFKAPDYEVVYNPAKGYDILCLTGGTDIDPTIYGEERNQFTSAPDVTRDAFEQAAFDDAVADGKVVVGICRGAQLICALSGGSIYQHIGGAHQGNHKAVTIDGREMIVTSSHHQMMNPAPLKDNYLPLMTCGNLCSTYQDGFGEVDPPTVDYEVIYFPKTNAIGHQPHPEWMDDNAEYHKYFHETVAEMFTSNPFNYHQGCC